MVVNEGETDLPLFDALRSPCVTSGLCPSVVRVILRSPAPPSKWPRTFFDLLQHRAPKWLNPVGVSLVRPSFVLPDVFNARSVNPRSFRSLRQSWDVDRAPLGQPLTHEPAHSLPPPPFTSLPSRIPCHNLREEELWLKRDLRGPPRCFRRRRSLAARERFRVMEEGSGIGLCRHRIKGGARKRTGRGNWHGAGWIVCAAEQREEATGLATAKTERHVQQRTAPLLPFAVIIVPISS